MSTREKENELLFVILHSYQNTVVDSGECLEKEESERWEGEGGEKVEGKMEEEREERGEGEL